VNREGTMTKPIRSTYFEISRRLSSIEREILAFQTGVMCESGSIAAGDSNLAIILAARLSRVWKRLGTAAGLKSRNSLLCD
jgi:hypothetical protein